ncbi:MAG: hypothetical protein JO079_14335, partial [Frankiaceae bacterium]|nr:hypothetical protein [Frankiaceae bacterium]
TPFVGLLTDGRAHDVQLGILDMTLAGGDFWAIAANLQAWTAHSAARTQGHLLAATAPANPTDTVTDPTTQGVPYTDTASHSLTFKGDRVVDGRHITTTVSEQMGETARQAVLVDDGAWTWTQSTTTEVGGHKTVDTQTAAYKLTTDVFTTYQIEDSGTTSSSVDGTRKSWTSYDETMRTADATGIAFNGVEQEQYGFADNTGTCYDHVLSSQASEVTVDQLPSGGCPSAPPA